MKEKIAVLTDSGSDLNKDQYENLFFLPLIIQIEGKTYIDGIDITLDEVLENLDNKKVTTSLPSPETIEKTLDQIKELGYTHVIVPTISSGLSGTHNIVRMIAEDYEGLEIKLIDTKNISKASGYSSLTALELIEAGLSFDEVVKGVIEELDNNRVYFTVGTVEYLRKGGRIGLVAGAIAGILNIKPIISCNVDGIYYSAKKTRGYLKAIEKTIELTYSFIEKSVKYDLTLLVAKIDEQVKSLTERIKDQFKRLRNLDIKIVTPALAIHTGPQAFGIAARKIMK